MEVDITMLIHEAVDPEVMHNKPDLGTFLDIADKMNSNTTCMGSGAKSIVSNLKSKDKNKRWHSVLLVEYLVKNCSMKFHYELLGKPFCQTVMKILQKRRGMKPLFNNLISKDYKIQTNIENKLQYLIQLWFDTFMMHEGEFKEIVGTYKQLRKEGVIFPQRDPNEAFMIKFTGTQSPIFQTMEENRIYEDPIKQLNPHKTYKVGGDYFAEQENHQSDGYGGGGPNFKVNPQYAIERYNENEQKIRNYEDDQAEHGELFLSEEDITVLKESCMLMDDIITNAEHLNELRSEISIDIIDNHTHNLKKLKRIVTNKEVDQPKAELYKLGVLYQTLKRQCRDFFDIVDAFKTNNMKRPHDLDYAKMKKIANQKLTAWKEQQEDEGEKDSPEKEKSPEKPKVHEVDLLGMGDDEPEQQQKEEPKEEKKESFDLLDMDFGNTNQTNQNTNAPNKNKPPNVQSQNMDLLGIDLFIGDAQDIKVEVDDDDFFDMLANRKHQF